MEWSEEVRINMADNSGSFAVLGIYLSKVKKEEPVKLDPIIIRKTLRSSDKQVLTTPMCHKDIFTSRSRRKAGSH